jgi:thiamine phosphate synthase YjbQ (UPF0047 family)
VTRSPLTTQFSFYVIPFTFAQRMLWRQYTLSLPPMRRGFHLVTPRIVEAAKDLPQVKVGLLHVFIQHTSASLTINENADPDVRVDMESSVNAIVPENFPYSVSVPVRDGRLATGDWQGIYLCEHRNHGGSRKLVLTLQGEA